ncbi:GTP cyclohydrolase [Paenibacillus darwinianus]|uniref:GTP cyclohydrolase II n=1 Tax=Paenibacillus darwinianus TaxID=1380763 RepID=A0A9W5S2Y2_9BACL|nr:GTP cyclohydrolase II [Paenibacillus darwinianus]EXX90194.1 GTP cyclohydrolase [Paenibacillus darwinianus]EXX90859.1 GTP cyclohydrolase [Paenibacillus darwinianus]EXX90912.1 GTP cyclohydrolase [Paenibacillus darwinianus]
MINTNIVDLLKQRIQTIPSEDGVNVLVGPIKLPVNLGGETVTFQWYCWLPLKSDAARVCLSNPDTETLIEQLSSYNLAEKQQSSVLVYGDFVYSEEALIRMHSICHTGDIFGSKRCDCGYQLEQSMKMVVAHGSGALFYLANHEGRGIGLFSKAMAYLLQENGLDTVEANLELGFADDARDYSDAIGILRHLRQKPVTLITNNPKKLEALKSSGMNVAGRMPLWGDQSEFNAKYLRTKVERSGHFGEREKRRNLS